MTSPASTQPAALRRPLQATIVCLLAVLALALTPATVLGQASDQYTEEPPSASGGNDPQNGGSISSPPSSEQGSGTNDGSSGAVSGGQAGGGGGGGGSTPTSSGGSGDSSVSPSGGAPAGAADGGADQGSSAGGGDSPAGATDNGAGKLNAEALPLEGTSFSSGSDDDDSSPVLPILIGILFLAALSVGAVLWRNRRQEGEAPESGQAADTA